MRDSDIDVASAEALQHGPQPHAPSPHPYEFRGTRTCDQCGCRWKMDDLSAPNPKDELCNEPVKWHPKKCLCHSSVYTMGLLDELERQREEVVLEI